MSISRAKGLNFELSRQISFEHYSNIKSHEHPSSGADLFHADAWTDRLTYGQTNRHDAVNCRFSKVFECASELFTSQFSADWFKRALSLFGVLPQLPSAGGFAVLAAAHKESPFVSDAISCTC